MTINDGFRQDAFLLFHEIKKLPNIVLMQIVIETISFANYSHWKRLYFIKYNAHIRIVRS
jgi:hypothetical protein